ncbi:hypothetical protein Patl1_34178 [Pistacia atlantica]|uniref:Uncharacterized protein n=1 Tax=Pistacia atlantica TaxID=434234 RepID=A0ACC0ZWI5_9ROSI|nr:hypothetical protein Patl1_34178 [Pistacia atlantica]
MDDVGPFVTTKLDKENYFRDYSGKGNSYFYSREGFMSGEGFKGTEFIDSVGSNYRSIYVEAVEHFRTPTGNSWWQKPNAEINWWQKLIIGVVVALAVPLLFFLCYRIRRKYKAKEEKWWQSLGIVLVIPLLCYYSYLIGKKLQVKGNLEQI